MQNKNQGTQRHNIFRVILAKLAYIYYHCFQVLLLLIRNHLEYKLPLLVGWPYYYSNMQQQHTVVQTLSLTLSLAISSYQAYLLSRVPNINNLIRVITISSFFIYSSPNMPKGRQVILPLLNITNSQQDKGLKYISIPCISSQEFLYVTQSINNFLK